MSRERSDAELARDLAAGDETALTELYDRYAREAFALACRLLGNPAEAEDVVQEIYLALHRNPRSYRGEAKFTTWMYRVVVNRTRNVIKKNVRERERRRKLAETMRDRDAAHETPREETDRDEQARRVREAVNELPAAQREALVLAKYQEKSYEEIGAILETSPDAVKMRVHRAMQALRRKFGVPDA